MRSRSDHSARMGSMRSDPTGSVAIVYSGFFHGRGEGVVQHITQLERTLRELGQETVVLSLESIPMPLRYLPHLVQYSTNAVAAPTGYYWRLAIGRQLLRAAYRRVARRQRICAVVFEDIYLPFNTGVPTLVMLHGLLSDTVQAHALSSPRVAEARRRDAECAVRSPYPVSVVSDAYRAHVITVITNALGRTAELDVLPLGIDVDRFPDPPERRPDGALRLAFLGYLEARKNVLFLPRVLEALRRRYSGPVHLTIGGDGPLRARLKAEIIARGVSDEVTLLGRIPRDEAARMLGAQHVLLLPSLKESFSQTLLEAKLAGLRTVATAGLDVPTEFIDAGVPLDPDAWADTIAQVGPPQIGASASADRLEELAVLRRRYSRRTMAELTLRKLSLS